MLRKLFPRSEFTSCIKSRKSYCFILILLVLLGCQESESVQTNLDIEKAKRWFQVNGANLSKATVNSSARGGRFEKQPDWSKSKIHHSDNGITAVEVVLDYETPLLLSDTELQSANPNVINSMVLFEVRPDEYEVYLFKVYPDDPTTSLNKEDFERFNYGEIPADFSGRIVVFDWDENFIGGWRVANGEKIRYIGQTRVDPASAKKNAKTDDTILCYQITIYWYSIACTPSTGECGDPILIDQFSYVECEVIIAPPDPSNPGGGGGGGGENPDEDCFEPHPFIEGLMVPCDEATITNNVTDPCIRQQVENAIAEGITNQISSLIQSIFNINDEINIEFTEDATLPNDVDAETSISGPPGGYPYNILHAVVSFNPNTLNSASQEYIMATTYHELLHAILFYNGITGAQQHSSMALQYISILSSALVEHFPDLSMNNAVNLSWAGLQDTNAWAQLSQTKRNNAITTNAAHKSGQSGTECN